MKKFLIASLICLTAMTSAQTNATEAETYKVLKVIDGDTMYIDFNRDGYYQKDEKVRVNGIDTFETKPTEFLSYQMKNYNLTEDEALGLGYYGKEFAKKNLLNKEVIVKFSTNSATEQQTSVSNNTIRSGATPEGQNQLDCRADARNDVTTPSSAIGKTSEAEPNTDATGAKTHDAFNRGLVSIYFTDGRSYEQEVLKSGLATVYEKSNLASQLKEFENLDEVYKNAEKARKLDLVLLNKKNGKYHKPTCKYGQMASNAELVQKPSIFSKYKLATCCDNSDNKELIPTKMLAQKNLKETNHSIDLMFNFPFYETPSYLPRTDSAKILLQELKNEDKSLDFLIYGISAQPAIYDEIVAISKDPNIKFRGIVDVNTKGQNDYKDTHNLQAECPRIKNDFAQKDEMQPYYDKKKKLGYLMHNKVFVFSNDHVWTGSTNISTTCSGGFNANVSYLIKDKQIADLYRKEISQMYELEKFHNDKEKVFIKDAKLADGTIISVYFSPNENIVSESILPSFKRAEKSISVGMFYLTNRDIIAELINAQMRGIDIKIIVDASFAKDNVKHIEALRNSGIKLKVENWAGKMHCKLAIIDDETILTGSLNWTNSGVNHNDENFLEITNKRIANETQLYFDKLWESIPEKWSNAIPSAEGVDSPNSCTDHIDNDHNWLTDDKDPKCQPN